MSQSSGGFRNGCCKRHSTARVNSTASSSRAACVRRSRCRAVTQGRSQLQVGHYKTLYTSVLLRGFSATGLVIRLTVNELAGLTRVLSRRSILNLQYNANLEAKSLIAAVEASARDCQRNEGLESLHSTGIGTIDRKVSSQSGRVQAACYCCLPSLSVLQEYRGRCTVAQAARTFSALIAKRVVSSKDARVVCSGVPCNRVGRARCCRCMLLRAKRTGKSLSATSGHGFCAFLNAFDGFLPTFSDRGLELFGTFHSVDA